MIYYYYYYYYYIPDRKDGVRPLCDLLILLTFYSEAECQSPPNGIQLLNPIYHLRHKLDLEVKSHLLVTKYSASVHFKRVNFLQFRGEAQVSQSRILPLLCTAVHATIKLRPLARSFAFFFLFLLGSHPKAEWNAK